MTRVNAKIIGIGFRILGLNKIVIQYAEGNSKSRSIAERLGFKTDGVLRNNEQLYDHFVDHVVYSLLTTEHDVSNIFTRNPKSRAHEKTFCSK